MSFSLQEPINDVKRELTILQKSYLVEGFGI